MSVIGFRNIFSIGKVAAVVFTAAMICAVPAQAQTGASDPHAQAQQPKSPQGQTGPLNTGSGGTSAASPQGETPPNMQAKSPSAADAPKGK